MRIRTLICVVLSIAVAANTLSAQTDWISDAPVSQQFLGSSAYGVACSHNRGYIGIATARGLLVKKGDQPFMDEKVGHLYSVDFSPDGWFVAGGGQDGKIRVWDMTSRKEIKTLQGHRAAVSSVRFSPDGKRMVSGSWDGSVILWNTRTWTSIKTLTGHTDEVYAVAFSPDGAYLASGGWDTTVRIWAGETVQGLELHGVVMAIAFSPDGRRLATGAFDGTVRLWSMRPSWAEEVVWRDVQSPVRSLIFSPEGDYLVSGHEDGGLRVRNLPAGRTVKIVPFRETAVTGLSFDSTTGRLISVARDGQFALWNTSSPPSHDRPPALEITRPAQSPFTTQDSSIVIVGIVTDDSKVKDITITTVSLFGAWGVERDVQVVPTGRITRFERSIPLQAGENRITVAAQDDAEVWTVQEIIVTYQTNSPPHIKVTNPKQYTTQNDSIVIAGIVTDDSIVIAGIVTDDSRVTDIKINDESLFGTGNMGRDIEVIPSEANHRIQFAKKISLLAGKNQIKVLAQDDAGASKVHYINITYQPFGINTEKYYALIIAVEDYQDPNMKLDYPLKNARDLIEVLTKDYIFEVGTDSTFMTGNLYFLKNPNFDTIIKVFDLMSDKFTETDNLLIFYAGHGHWDKKLQQGYWLPIDAMSENRSKWVSNSTVRDYIKGIQTRHTLLIADACFSGSIFRQSRSFLKTDSSIQKIYEAISRKAITSGAQEAVPDKSVFMEYLIKRLRENRKECLIAQEVYILIQQAVMNNSDQRPLYGVIQGAGDEGPGDFIFIRR